MGKRIYVAASWRTPRQPGVVQMLRAAGHEVYDFRNPKPGNNGFQWSDIDKDWQTWTPEQYCKALDHEIAEAGFGLDLEAMTWANVFVGVQPFGRSASMEMGWAAGRGKTTILLLTNGEPELMVKMFDHVVCSLDAVIELLKSRPNAEVDRMQGGSHAR